ncbi:hypothetical protein Hanom_Chr11g01043901 [Helianthus anomalus]
MDSAMFKTFGSVKKIKITEQQHAVIKNTNNRPFGFFSYGSVLCSPLTKIRVKYHFRLYDLASFATSVQMFVFPHLLGLKSCHFHPAR